jgi:rhodanese-related sulfurtransferase
VILDVLTPERYATGHIPGAINIPFGDLRERAASELPDPAREIVAYCGGPT